MSQATEELIDLVERIREKRGITKVELATEIGKAAQYPRVVNWLNKVSEPSLESFLMLQSWCEKHEGKWK